MQTGTNICPCHCKHPTVVPNLTRLHCNLSSRWKRVTRHESLQIHLVTTPLRRWPPSILVWLWPPAPTYYHIYASRHMCSSNILMTASLSIDDLSPRHPKIKVIIITSLLAFTPPRHIRPKYGRYMNSCSIERQTRKAPIIILLRAYHATNSHPIQIE